MSKSNRLSVWLAVVVLTWPTLAISDDLVSTFTLDGLSFISFGDQQILLPATGATIVFRFGTPAANGSTPFTIAPEDVSIRPIALPSGDGTLQYSIAFPASGRLTPTADGRRLTFTATVRAALSGDKGNGSYDYAMPFSTETASATNAAGKEAISVTGMRLVDGLWYGQIVGATTNGTNAYPEPGAAVYTVLSGRFDQIP